LEIHLQGEGVGQKKIFDKFVGRVRSKITPKKLRELNDIGWFHLFSILLVMTKVSQDPRATAAKWKAMLKDAVKLEEIRFGIQSISF
jgi:hypothetical protein